MIKHLLTTSMVLIAMLSFSQNLDFENWTSNELLYLDDYETMTHNNAIYGPLAVMRSTDFYEGTYSIRLETVASENDGPVFGYFANGDPETYENGQVVTLNAIDSVIGYYKYNIMPDDTALFLCMAKFNGAPSGGNIFPIKGSQPTWKRFSYPVLASSVDTVIIASASSNAINNIGIAVGSWIMLDDIQLKSNSNGLEAINNSGFENWTTESWDDLDAWLTPNLYGVGMPTLPVTKTANAHSGNYASQLETVESPYGDYLNGFMSLGQYSNNGPLGGFPYSEMPESVRFYYKTQLQTDDTAFVSIIFKKNGTPIDYKGGYIIQSASSYTLWEMPVALAQAPDTIFLAFSVGNSLGAQFTVDAFEFAFNVSTNDKYKIQELVAFPNPARDYLKFETQGIEEVLSIEIFNLKGQKMGDTHLLNPRNQSSFSIDISNLKAGQYVYQIQTKDDLLKKHFIKQ